MNVAISDDEHAVVSRFTDADDGVPESLYYFTGQLYPDVGTRAKRKGGTQAVTVSSERLTSDSGGAEVPPGHDHHLAARPRAAIRRRAHGAASGSWRSPRASAIAVSFARLEHRYRPRDGRADARYWMIVPNSSPIPAVAAIASAPQNVTRPAAAAT